MTHRNNTDLVIGALSGRALPGGGLARLLGKAPLPIDRIADDAVAVQTLADLILRSVEKNTRVDGRVDYRDVASDVLRVMKGNQR